MEILASCVGEIPVGSQRLLCAKSCTSGHWLVDTRPKPARPHREAGWRGFSYCQSSYFIGQKSGRAPPVDQAPANNSQEVKSYRKCLCRLQALQDREWRKL